MKYTLRTLAIMISISLSLVAHADSQSPAAIPETVIPASVSPIGPHVHGSATLQIAVDANVLTLNFSSPLINLVGFEHKARNQAELDQVQHMINAFYKMKPFVPTASAQCKLTSIDLRSILIKKNPKENKPDHIEPAGHADLDADLVYTCKNVKNLHDLQVNLFESFTNLHHLNAEIVSEHGQSAAKILPSNSLVVW